MAIIERYQSPDGLLRLTIDVTGGDWTVGFAGYGWHTHGDILCAFGYEGAPEEATRAFAEDVINSRRIIAVYRIDGNVKDVTVPDDLVERPLDTHLGKYAAPGETVEMRYWDGRAATG